MGMSVTDYKPLLDAQANVTGGLIQVGAIFSVFVRNLTEKSCESTVFQVGMTTNVAKKVMGVLHDS